MTKRKTNTAWPWLLLVGALAGCADQEAPPEPKLRPVRYQEVTYGGVESSRNLAGVARAGTEADLSFRVSGTAAEVSVSLGDRVRTGQVLARLDPVDFELQVQEAEAGLAQAQAAVRKSDADYDRTRALYENNNASRSELDASRASAESARSLVDAASKRLELARQQLAYTVLRAPADGAIALKDLEVNENVRAGDPVFMMTSGEQIEVEFSVPEIMIAGLEVGMPVTVRFDVLRGREFAGEIVELGVAVTQASAAYEATARLTEEAPDVRSGMAAEVVSRVTSTSPEESLVVPWVAVGEDREGRFVFVVEPSGDGTAIVHRRPVVLGEVGKEIEVVEGLDEGELLVTAGTRRLAEGMRVRIDPLESPTP